MPTSRWIMSPQARRRLVRVMADSELNDLAEEIARDLKAVGVFLSPREIDVVRGTLTREEA